MVCHKKPWHKALASQIPISVCWRSIEPASKVLRFDHHYIWSTLSLGHLACEEARLAAGYAPTEAAPGALHKLSLMEMFLRLPPHVREDVRAQVEGLYFKYHSRRVIGSPHEQSGGTTGDLETSDTPNEASREVPSHELNHSRKPKAVNASPQKR